MNLGKIQAFSNVTKLSESTSIRNLSSIAEKSGLTDAELRMITNTFPSGQNNKLELYLSSGITRMENPDAMGKNLDFRI